MTGCFTTDFTIPGDNAQNSLKRIVLDLANGDSIKQAILISYFGSKKFADYLEKQIGQRDYTKVNKNSLRKHIREYYENGHLSILNSATRRQGSTYIFGFDSVEDMRQAEETTITYLIDEYLTSIKENKSAKSAIINTANRIFSEFINNFGINTWNKINENDKYKQDNLERYNSRIVERNARLKELDDINKQIKDTKEKELKKGLIEQRKTIKKELLFAENEIFSILYEAVRLHGDVSAKAYSKLAFQIKINPNRWFDKVFISKKINRYKKTFENVLDSSEIQASFYEDDINFKEVDENDIDLESRRWVDDTNRHVSFTELVDLNTKLYLSSIRRLKSNRKITVNGETTWDYDTDNVLKTANTVGADYLIMQLTAVTSKYSLPMFIESIKRASSIPGLECLAIIAEDCISNKNLANKLFHELANEAIEKTIIDIDNVISNNISNTSVNPVSTLFYNLQNIAKFTIKDNFDIYQLSEIETKLNNINPANLNPDTAHRNLADNALFVKKFLVKYFPQLDVNAVDSYLKQDLNQYGKRYQDLLTNVRNLIEAIGKVIEAENKLVAAHNKRLSIWRKHRVEISDFSVPRPIMDYNAIPYNILNTHIIGIVQKLAPFIAVRSELNSFNAQGNLGSDLIENNNITNLIKQINYSTPEDEFAGLRALGNFINNVAQYEHSPIFWGVKDSQGNIIVPGLFIKNGDGTFSIHKDAKRLISFSLFNGVRDQSNDTNELYNTMSKVDYFMSNLINYNKPALHISQYGMQELHAYFLRTPSDAPKNFIINAPGVIYDGLYSEDEQSTNNYLKLRGNGLINQLNLGINNAAEKAQTNGKTNSTLQDIVDLMENPPETFNAAGYSIRDIAGKTYVTFRIPIGNSFMKVAFSATRIDKGSAILKDLKINSSYSPLYNNQDTTKYNTLVNFIKDFVVNEGINNGQIKRNVNIEHGLFRGFRQQLLNELNTFIYNLNNILDSKDGYRTKTDTHLLFDQYHLKNGVIVKDGKLTGNVFSFIRLFNTNDFDTNSMMQEALFLYGQGNNSLLIPDGSNRLKLNTNHPIINVNRLTGEITLRENAISDILNNITEQWLNAFSQEIVERSQQYNTVTNEEYSSSQIAEYLLNSALMDMNFDDIFEGDAKFYKDARNFLKRAKEVQASGKSYAAIDFNSEVNGELKQLTDYNGNLETIKIGNIELPVKNGFKGVTIKNTVRPSDHAEKIYKELLKLNTSLPDSTRERIALQIAKGFGYKNKRGETKTNDAQSFITIEEWARRAYLSGELEQFKDILPILMDEKATPEQIAKLDIQKINKFIQVQKNFYFDRQKDAVTGVVYARQIKNAEFVLIPALIKGTSLFDLYRLMKNNNIDQINTAETDKAAKRVILEFWDNNGDVSLEAYNKFAQDLSNINNTETYYYRYLYKQQSVAQHMQDKTNKAGIQIMKKILDNLDDANIDLANQFFDNYIANIKEDYDIFLDNMGWKTVNGRIVDKTTGGAIKFDKFYKRAREEAERLGLDSNFVDYVTLDELGFPMMPDFMNIAASKFESIAQSMFNRSITRQTLPGWHAAQVTSVGYDSNLKFDPETGIMEVYLPRWTVDIPKGYDIEKLRSEGLDIHIGYRIPTEGKQSIAILRVKGFLDDVQGSTIIVPDEWVTKTGSDFDVDSVYGISFKHKVNKKTGEITKIRPIEGTDEESVKKRYRNFIRRQVQRIIDNEGINALYDKLTTDKVIFTSSNQVENLYKSQAGIDFLVGQLGIMGINKFSKLTLIEQQIPDARTNSILEAMIKIMESSATREENYSRSNFDNLTDAKDIIDFLRKRYNGEQNKVESTYNPFDQIDYMENAMSGASLKAFSVTRDTFNSVANFSKATLNSDNAITVIYDLTETVKDVKDGQLVDTKVLKYNLETIQSAYPEAVVSADGRFVTVTHKNWAWSANNRNVLGMLLTPYSSQTTAHILDAIKEGSIFNENKFTFGTFKTLLDLGIDYDTAIAFLQQPAITEIVNAYNETNSIYSNVTGRPIEVALARIARAAGIKVNGNEINDNTSQYAIFKELSENETIQNIVKQLTGGEITLNGKLHGGQFTLSSTRLQERFNKAKIDNNSENYNTLTFVEDLLTLMHFADIYHTTANIEKIIRCTNPDKFGAKQSIFATRTVINNIKEYTRNNTEIRDLLSVGDKSFLEALYPNIENGDIDINSSCYKYLAAFLKYATMPSVDVNSQIFTLENERIYKKMLDIQDQIGIKFTEERAAEFKRYLVTAIYNQVPQLTATFTVDDNYHFKLLKEDNTEDTFSKEVDRIFGYVQTESTNIEIADINNVNEETELPKFLALTPAQKIVFIKNHFKGDAAAIFNYLNVNHFKNKDIIRYNDTLGNIEDLYIAFNRSFFCTNKLIRLAALDLIKYAFVVEGFKFKKGAISKIITNDALLAPTNQQGIGLTPITSMVQSIIEAKNNFQINQDFEEQFVRSHSEYLRTIKIGKAYPNSFASFFNQSTVFGEGFFIPNNDSEIAKSLRNGLKIEVDENGHIRNTVRYVKISHILNKKRTNILYKLEYRRSGIYGYPLNTLESNETSKYSFNNDNNRFKVPAYYLANISHFNSNGTAAVLKISDFLPPVHKTETIKEGFTNVDYLINLNETGNKTEQALTDKLFKEINTWYSNTSIDKANELIIHNESIELKSIIPYGTTIRQNIVINGQNVLFEISQYNPSKRFRQELKGIKPKRNSYNTNTLTKAEEKVIDSVKSSGVVYPKLYKVTIALSEDVESTNIMDEFNYGDVFSDDFSGERTASTSTINLEIDDIEHPFNSLNQTAKDIVDSIHTEHKRNPTEDSKDFETKMRDIELDNTDTDSVREHSKEIYHEAANYYEKKAKELLNRINNFVLDNTDNGTYNIGQEELYHKLVEYMERFEKIKDNPTKAHEANDLSNKYNELIKLILDCYTFGNQFADITSLDLNGEDAELTNDIERLKKAINKIQSNTNVKTAMKNIFNIYLAESTSNNPMVIYSKQFNSTHGLINLRDTFNDSGWFDSKISDIGFINNKQVQVVVKYINSRLNAVTRFDVPELLAAFDREFEDIMKMAGILDWNNIVDKDGKLRKEYNKQFIEDYNTHIDTVINALCEYGPLSKEYWDAKLAKDAWFAENTHQPMVAEYYKELNAANQKAYNNAQEEFLEYQTLVAELRSLSGNAAELDRTQLIRKKEILSELSFFTSKFNSDGTEKSAEKQAKLEFIKEWKIKKREINNKYYDTTIVDGIKEKIAECVSYITEYDNAHPDLSLDEKKIDEQYREYYDWLQYNTVYSLNKQSNDILLDAYSKFSKGENDKLIRVNGILRGKDVYDEYGNLDPSKISIEDMAKIKEIYETENTKLYEQDDAENALIKAVGKKTIICTDEYYNQMNSLFNNQKRNKRKMKVIKQINEYLIKGVDNSGKLSPKLLFENLTNEEIQNVVDLISQYNSIEETKLTTEQKEGLKRLQKKRIVDATAFESDLAWANANLSNEQLDYFKMIFCARSKKGKFIVRKRNGKKQNTASQLFYSISRPQDKWIDTEKTRAKDIIDTNVEYTVKDIYYKTKEDYYNRAVANNNFDEYNAWYKANHIYNSATHKMEPLNIWKTRTIKQNPRGLVTVNNGVQTVLNTIDDTYEYNPAFEHTKWEAKEKNPLYNENARLNYNGSEHYRNNIALNDKESKMRDLFQRVLDRQATTDNMKRKAEEGFMPRRAKIVKDGKWYLRQGFGSLGLDWSSYKDKQWSDDVKYETDRDGDLSIIQQLRNKGTIDLNTLDKNDPNYEQHLKEAKENNARIDAEIRDNDWISIMKDYIETSTIYNAKEDLKNTSLLLLEDLKHQNAMKINHTDNVSISKKRSTSHNQVANEVVQKNTIEIVENWHKRLFRNQYKKKSKYNEAASLFQNITSAKYMIFNVTGGIANVWTGLGNILGETLAGEFLDNKHFAEANSQYAGNFITFFAEMYSDKSSSLTNALIKRFNVVDYEAFSERRPDEKLSEYIKRARNWMYGLQSGGEHYMQNTVMLGMLKSHRLYTDYRGKIVAGTFDNYVWELETQTLINLIKNNPELLTQYKMHLSEIKSNKQELYKYETLKKNINTDFVRNFLDSTTRKAYIAAKKENYKKAEQEFNNDEKHPTLESQFELKEGYAVLKQDSPIGKIALGDFTNKVIYVNKKIHGVYDKIGAAQIEKEWWGSLTMQYHKHLYPGFMKRWRINGYFNEQLNAKDKGSYISAINLLTIDFDKALNVAKNDAEGQKAKQIIKSVQNIAIQALNNLRQIKTNYELLPQWEQANIRRSYADSINTLACIAMAIGIHVAYDQDEIKDSNTISTMVYLADRFASEAQSFTPWGAYGEAKTLYSSPIASLNSPGDLVKLISLISQTLVDPDFETSYNTGLYKGRNKFEVLLTRNIPIVRIKNRLEMMSKNNQYYRLNQNMLKIVPVSTIGDYLAGRD